MQGTTEAKADKELPALEQIARDVTSLEDRLDNLVIRYRDLRDRLVGPTPTAVANADVKPPSQGMVPGLASKVDNCNGLAGELTNLIIILEEIA